MAMCEINVGRPKLLLFFFSYIAGAVLLSRYKVRHVQRKNNDIYCFLELARVDLTGADFHI